MEQRLSTPLLSKLREHQRNCINCNELFIPDARNRHHQKYCSKQECRSASKRESQKRWLSSSKGAGYFQNQDNVERVQQWRKAHPGYWKRKRAQCSKEAFALQDLSNLQDIENKGDQEDSRIHALQDVCLMQPALIIGLIANLTGSTLQDDIASTSRRFIDSGRDILGTITPIGKTT